MTDHLRVPLNQRFLSAMDHLRNTLRKSYRTLCAEMGYAPESFDKIKRGERSLPEEYHAAAATMFDHYGISTHWFLTGVGEMLKPSYLASDDDTMLRMLQKELRIKEQLLRKVNEENQALRAELRQLRGD